MQEPSLDSLSLARLLEMQKSWQCQIKAAYEGGKLNLAQSLFHKLDSIQPLIEQKRGENLNDLFA